MVVPEVLFEDNHLLVVNKCAGWLTQPNDSQDTNVEDLCKSYLKEKYQKPGNVFLHPIHRLDRPASGVVVLARTSKALSRMQSFMRNKETRKTYYALVENRPPSSEGVLENYLFHDDYRAVLVEESAPHAKKARLQYRVLAKKENFTLLEVDLDTGRYHQIRVQLAAIGCPIVGDAKYGSQVSWPEKTIGLHHFCMQIPHPISLKVLNLQAPLPFSLTSFLKSLSSIR
jgi:23S rRNA pseudouridine1911/1915/1917 synthase